MDPKVHEIQAYLIVSFDLSRNKTEESENYFASFSFLDTLYLAWL